LDCSDPAFDADCRRAITKKNGSPTVHLIRDYHPERSRRLQAEANKSQCDRGVVFDCDYAVLNSSHQRLEVHPNRAALPDFQLPSTIVRFDKIAGYLDALE
jgi:hypothetical protein